MPTAPPRPARGPSTWRRLATSMPSWWIRCGATVLTRCIASVSLALDVATDEDAVVLLEHEGCYTWLRPRHETSRDPQVIGRVAVFEFVVPPAGAATRDLGGLAAGAARATV